MARIDGTDRGFHILATSAVIVGALYSAFRVFRAEEPRGLRRVFLTFWLPLICVVFLYGFHETVFNPLYFGRAYMGGQEQAVVRIYSDPANVFAGLLDVQIAMFLFGFISLYRYLKVNVLPWCPFIALAAGWFIIGMPVSVPTPGILHPALTNTLSTNILEGLYTCTFVIGFCGSFK